MIKRYNNRTKNYKKSAKRGKNHFKNIRRRYNKFIKMLRRIEEYRKFNTFFNGIKFNSRRSFYRYLVYNSFRLKKKRYTSFLTGLYDKHYKYIFLNSLRYFRYKYLRLKKLYKYRGLKRYKRRRKRKIRRLGFLRFYKQFKNKLIFKDLVYEKYQQVFFDFRLKSLYFKNFNRNLVPNLKYSTYLFNKALNIIKSISYNRGLVLVVMNNFNLFSNIKYFKLNNLIIFDRVKYGLIGNRVLSKYNIPDLLVYLDKNYKYSSCDMDFVKEFSKLNIPVIANLYDSPYINIEFPLNIDYNSLENSLLILIKSLVDGVFMDKAVFKNNNEKD